MPAGTTKTLLIVAAALLASACATSSPSGPQFAQDAPWWEKSGPCRIWVPVEPQPGRTPAWDAGPSTPRMSNTGDCRALQAALPDGAVLIGSP
ncbi:MULTISPECIES: hypothetical protein [unclassified Wenzhouxiangella]|uniref:hypothetical protein n=1 Tax=unclassified Wenzhouxiangella TaxID=2613841 RepID=UPI000E326C25|nr:MULTISPECIES: hypothetical protein [unclassified Wenzhouxiangella]RFF28996.1 hypothetical protein DZK25_00405 [Wenzhouxiangella sp. 15181]RFP68298.1 hypothetical protein DZK26_08650 [Wenzhouxiangella sp. 15190]